MSSSNHRLQKLTLSFSECLGCGDRLLQSDGWGLKARGPDPIHSQLNSGAPVRMGL